MSDFRTQEAGATNPRGFTLVKRADGSPITTGTVNWYLKNISGANAGKWWRDSDQTWQVAETANAMTHQADGHWTRTLAATPWVDGDVDLEYAKESGDLHVPASRMLKVEYTPSATSTRRVDLGLWVGSAPNALTSGRVDASAGALAAGVVTAAAVATDAIDADALATDGITEIVAAVWAAAARTLTASLDPTAAQIRAEMDSNSTRLAHLDADVSTRSTYAGADTAGTTTLLARLTSTRAGLLDNLDAAISTRLAAASYTAPDNADIATLVARLTSTRATLLDNLANLDAAISSRSTYAGGAVASVTADVGITQAGADKVWGSAARTLTSFGTLVADIWAAATRTLTAIVDSSGVTTLLGRLTSGRATNLDNLDAAVSTRSTLGGTAQTGDAFARLGAPAGASIAADVATRLAASAYSAPPSAAAIDTQLSGTHGSGAWGGGSSGAGTGANTVTVTVTDGTSPIQGAKVRATLGATSNLLTTDASGHAVFLLDNGTWAIAATAPGYQGASVSQAIAGNASVSVALTAVVVTPPADPAQSTAYTLAYAPGVTLTFQLSVPPSGDGHLFSAAAVTGTANGAGLLEAALYRGATYGAYQGAKYLGSLAVPDADTFALPNWEGA